MKKDDEVNGVIGKMREEHANRSGGPDRARMEESVVRRLVAGVRVGRIVIALLAVFILVGLAAAVYWKFFRPSESSGDSVVWRLGTCEVTVYPTDDTGKTEYNIGYYDSLLHEGSSFWLYELPEPLGGSRWVAVDINDNESYWLLPSSETPPYSSMNVCGNQNDTWRVINGLTEKMLPVKLWPVPLWKLRPVVAQLGKEKYTLISPGPFSGFTTISKLYFADEEVYTLRGASYGNNVCTVNLTLWPDHFSLQPSISNQFTMLGNTGGYTTYQTERSWGSGVDWNLIVPKKSLWMHLHFLGLAKEQVPPEFSQWLAGVVDTLWQHGPERLEPASQMEQRMMIRPWFWEGYDPESERRRNEYRNTRPKFIPAIVGGVEVSKPEHYDMGLARGDTSLNIKSNYTSVGTYVDVQVNGENKVKFYIRHEKPYPVLKTRFDPETEKLLADAASIARAVLAEPASSWPNGVIPEPYLECWLGAIASREIVLEREAQRSMVSTEIEWVGDDVGLIINSGDYKAMDLDLRIATDGFALNLGDSGSLITSKDGQLSVLQAPGGRQVVLTERECERLRACVQALDALQEYTTAKVSPKSDYSPEGLLEHKVPEGVKLGIEALRHFLADPKLPPAEEVAALPPIGWDDASHLARLKLLSQA